MEYKSKTFPEILRGIILPNLASYFRSVSTDGNAATNCGILSRSDEEYIERAFAEYVGSEIERQTRPLRDRIEALERGEYRKTTVDDERTFHPG